MSNNPANIFNLFSSATGSLVKQDDSEQPIHS